MPVVIQLRFQLKCFDCHYDDERTPWGSSLGQKSFQRKNKPVPKAVSCEHVILFRAFNVSLLGIHFLPPFPFLIPRLRRAPCLEGKSTGLRPLAEKHRSWGVSHVAWRELGNALPWRVQNQEKRSEKSFQFLEQATPETHYLWTIYCMKPCMYIFIFAQSILRWLFKNSFILWWWWWWGLQNKKSSHFSSPIQEAIAFLSGEWQLCRRGGCVLNLCKVALLSSPEVKSLCWHRQRLFLKHRNVGFALYLGKGLYHPHWPFLP